MSNPLSKVIAMVNENPHDFQYLGLLFLRLLEADFKVLSNQPSATLATVLCLEQEGTLGLWKKLNGLFSELEATGMPPLTDGFGGSILRNHI